MSDPRKKFIVSNCCTLLGYAEGKQEEVVRDKVGSAKEVMTFLENPNCNLLQVICKRNDDGDPDITLCNKMKSDSWDDPDSIVQVHFVKLRPEPITEDNFVRNVMVTSMVTSPLHALYNSVHRVYAPMLLKDVTWSEKLDRKMQKLLAVLDAGLGSVVRSGSAQTADIHDKKAMTAILTPCDEFKLWSDMKSHKKYGDSARRFSDSFGQVSTRFESLEKSSLPEVLELIEDTQNVLDDVWKAEVPQNCQYPQHRMKHLFGVIAGALARYIQSYLGEMKLWKGPFSEVVSRLREATNVCERWIQTMADLSGTYWPTHDTHAWVGDQHKDDLMKNMAKRLEEILRLRTTHEELLRLLSVDEQAQLKVDRTFDPFQDIQPLHYNPYTQPLWNEAVKEYERTLAPIEQHISNNLRQEVSGLSDRPQQLLREFMRYRNLMARKNISKNLQGERETLLAQLTAYVEQLDNDFETFQSESKAPAGKNMPRVTNIVVWAKQLEAKLQGLMTHSQSLLGDLPSHSDFSSAADELLAKTRQWRKDEFEKWCMDTEDKLEDGELSLEMTGTLMEIDHKGTLVVNYSERLVTLLREVRQLDELGHSVPRKIRGAATDAEKYYRYGVMLKKVANFFNSMDSEIIDTQKPMLLDGLVGFEKTLGRKNSKGKSVTWSDPHECQEYVDRLQKAAERLSFENRKLRKVHSQLGEQVVALMAVDLLRQRDLWKNKWHVMKEKMEALSRKYPPERMSKWQLHWDHQVYKSLEAGYKMGLESLNENLPEIKAELVFTQKRLQFRPPLEDLRSHYYKEMKRFLSIPTQFQGFGNEKIFKRMSSRNGASLIQVYKKAEAMFGRLEELRNGLLPWVALGTLKDIDDYVRDNIKSTQEYDVNFKMIKKRQKQSEKLPDFYKVDCVNVSAAPFKAAVDDQIQRLSDALLLSLRKNLLEQVLGVEEFLTKAMTHLNSRPQSIEEIGNAKKEWKSLAENKKTIKADMRRADEKRKLLISVAGNRIDTEEVRVRLAKLPSRWENFEIAMEAFNDMIEEQREALKSDVDNKIMEVNMKLDKFSQRWHALKPKEVASWEKEAVEKIFDTLEDWQEQFDALKNEADTLATNCEHFQMPAPSFEGLEALAQDMETTQGHWELQKVYAEEWHSFCEQDWITFRTSLYVLADFMQKWAPKVKGEKNVVALHIREELEMLKKAQSGLKYCKGDVPFNEVHWSQLFRQLGIEKGTRLENLTAGHFLSRCEIIATNEKFCKSLTARATGEVRIREAMMELKEWCTNTELVIFDHEELGRTTMLITDWKDMFTALGDNQSLLGSLKDSAYFKPFADEASIYENNFSTLDMVLHNLNIIQRKWLYLEPIFGRGALPNEQQRFRRVDEEFRDAMEKVERDPHIINLCDQSIHPGLQENTEMMKTQLERCQKALSDFLEEKRSKMPRFYFIGDEDLLEILGQAKNPIVIQSHLKKLFQGLNKVDFNEEKTQITAIKSSKGEVVGLFQPVPVSEKTEEWLTMLSDEMRRSLANILVDCLKEESPDLNRYPSQLLCLAELMTFTRRTEEAIGGGQLHALKKQLEETLKMYTSYDLSGQPLQRRKVSALVLDLMHLVEVIQYLIDENVTALSDWAWNKQLRFYLVEELCVARMVDAELKYTYEYQGNAGKLCHTPLTDKCYLTLTQGMHQGFGGNPYGPAGTGKTESVKALGAAVGRQVLVFNCDEGIDFQSMGRIFTGLVKCGAWGCFDEFNRLKEDQLSAVSQQIQKIQDAIKNLSPRMVLMGADIEVDHNAAIFVTMNPAGKGYGGRSKLPDNLKMLFRPVAMSRPDNDLIAEVILTSEGFQGARVVGRKMVALFNLSKQLLSKQIHYDWGLRAMKAILVTGGKLIQQEKQAGTAVDVQMEQELLIKAVRVNTLSKLTYSDANIFEGLCTDIFPDAKVEDIRVPELEAAIKEVMEGPQFGLRFDEGQMRKMLQLKESLDQRMGCVIVGPSGCGKSTVWRVLAAAIRKCGTMVKEYVMNPKSMPRELLLGHMDMDTREWSDGVLTDASKQMVKEPMEVRSWIICDGDVDPEWIESLNTVLDDNKLLTLPNGERINFGPNINFLFETHDLRWASPATISRCGMIFLSDADVDVKRLTATWLDKQPEDMRMKLGGWLEDLFFRGLRWVLKLNQFIVDTTMVGTVLNGLSHVKGCTCKGEFVIGLIRGLGGNLNTVNRTAFAKEVFAWAGERPADPSAPLDCYWDADRRAFNSFVTRAPDDDITRASLQKGLIVPTAAYQRNVAMIEKWVDEQQPFIIVGPEGCGKSAMLNKIFTSKKGTCVTTLHCNAQTTAKNVTEKISESCGLFSTNTGRVYRPRDGDRLILYLKDINLPKPDQYDTCMLIAFLQQICTFNGFYDDNLEFLSLENVVVVASINPSTTVGRHPLSSRFTAIVRIAYVDYPSTSDLTHIYSVYLQAALDNSGVRDRKWEDKKNLERLARTMVDLYEAVKNKFTVDDHRHYLLTPRDLTKWVLGLGQYSLMDEDLLDVFSHEVLRLISDRLVDADSQKKFSGMLGGLLKKHWKHKPDLKGVYFTTFAATGDGKEEEKTSGVDKGDDMKRLLRCSEDDYKEFIKQGKIRYEREEKALPIKLFPEILEHIAKAERVLSRPGGSILFVGRSGVGRRSSVQLASFMLGMKFISPNLKRGYGPKEFKNDLKDALLVAGVEGEQVLLYVEDHQFVEDFILECINSLLSAGEVPGLYTHEELGPMLEPLKEEMSDQGLEFDYRSPYAYFVHRCKRNVHVCLGMDSVNTQFMPRCMSNPALFTRCSIMWFGEWRRSSMEVVPPLLFPDLLESIEDSDQLIQQMVDIHITTTSVQPAPDASQAAESKGGDGDTNEFVFSKLNETATPRDFMSFLKSYEQLYNKMKDGILSNAQRMEGGLAKLNEAADTVDTLKKNAVKQRATLAEAQKDADEAMENITAALEQASTRRQEVTQLQETLAVAEAETNKRKGAIEEELASIKPILMQAKKAVGQISADNLNEIRSLKMPPEPIRDVLAAVLMLLGINDTSWLSMRNFLGRRGVKEEILNFNTDRISNKMRKQVSKLLKKKADSFEHKTIVRVSVAAAPLAAWVKANVRYSVVLVKVKPLQEELMNANKQLTLSKEKLEENDRELKRIEQKVQKLKKEFANKTREAENLRSSLEKTELTLQKAETLLGKLSGEQGRWKETVKELRREVKELPPSMLIAAGFVTYLGKSDEKIRARATKIWKRLTGLRKFDFKRALSNESELLTWKGAGLPSDDLTMQNAIMIVNCNRTPFIIDPSATATMWLTGQLKQSGNVEILPCQDERFTNQVELAVRFGKTLMITEVDEVEAMLYPVVRRDFGQQGSRLVVNIGDKVIDFNESFKLFMVTRNPRPFIPPDAMPLIMLVNFSVTRSGLEGQLLGVTIHHERPELEQQKSEMLQKEEAYKVQLAALEAGLLAELAASEGNLLENQALIDSLTQTKIKSTEISKALEESVKATLELDRQRNVYTSFSEDGARLFFCMKNMQNTNHMYQFSLGSFLVLFNKTLNQKMDADDVEARLRLLTPALEHRVLFYVGRSIFKADRLMWAIHLVHCMHEDQFKQNEWDFFVGKLVATPGKSGSRDFPQWAAKEREDMFGLFQQTFPETHSLLRLDDADWGRWARSATCEREFPAKLAQKLSPFQRLLTVQTLRPDRLQSAMDLFVCEVLGLTSVMPQPNNLERIFKEETAPSMPVLFIVTTGADPCSDLFEYAKETVGQDQYFEMAMGGGQQAKAENLLKQCSEAGTWLCIKNLHLVVTWLPTLEKMLNSMKPNPNFRLWLTTETHSKFPTILIQQSLKITFESPPGVKKNLQRTYDSWTPKFIGKGSPRRAQLLFLLAWFHALVQERRNFIPQGWSKFYEFSLGDLRAATNVIEMLMKQDNPKALWPTLHGMMKNALYGNRISNIFDGRAVMAYLRRFFNTKMLEGSKLMMGINIAMPSSNNHGEYSSFIAKLPDQDPPAMFGLPANIERSAQRANSDRIIKDLKALAVTIGGAGSFDREKWRTQLTPILETWDKMTKADDSALRPPDVRDQSESKQGNAQLPCDAFTKMELQTVHELVMLLDSDLQALKKVLYGGGLLTPQITKTAEALLQTMTPMKWEHVWEGPEEPQPYMQAVVKRKVALCRWLEDVKQGTLLDSPLRLSELLHPGTFLNALRQQSARAMKQPLDELKMISAWDKSRLSGAKLIVEFTGLMLQGASFKNNTLTEADTNDLELITVPNVYIAFVNKTASDPYSVGSALSAPCYYTTIREQLLCEIHMPIEGNSVDKWILAGVALSLADKA